MTNNFSVSFARSREKVKQGRRHARLWCNDAVLNARYDPRGTGIVAFSPAAFVTLNVVSSALLFGMVITGAKCRNVSFKTLASAVNECEIRGEREQGENARHGV